MLNMKKIVGILTIASLVAAPMLASTANAERTSHLAAREEPGRLTLTNGGLTVIVTAEGKHPQFFWYANNLNNTIYHIKYKGIVEFIDMGQEIFQRKFKADLERFIRTGADGIMAISASKVGKNVTLSGSMNQNRDVSPEKIFNYVLREGDHRIGVNITKQTLARGDLNGDVIIRGTIAQSGSILYVKAISVTSLEVLRAELGQTHHPSLFEFNQGKWKFSGLQPIKAGSKVIGYQFNFTLSGVNNKFFNYLENQIVIRNRLYNSTVKEGNITVTKASMKTDIMIKTWKWELNSTEGRLIDIPLSKDKIALWLELTAFRAGKVADAMEEKAERVLTEVQSRDKKIETKEDEEKKGVDEKALETYGREHRITFLSQSKTLGGYFNFSNTATLYPKGNPAEAETVKVRSAYLPDDHKLKLFIVYPNFGAKSLEHDPQIGVITDEPITPLYAVDLASLKVEQLAQLPEAPPPAAVAQPVAPLPAPQPQQPGPAPAPQPQPQAEQPAPAQAPQSKEPANVTSDISTLAIVGVVAGIVAIAIAVAARRSKWSINEDN
ncbi:MAG: hypothetical protein HYU02_08680 [Thaumarchaeota archaeon]|nr:hypothetical protein [Nitrososphaerota archaeon]